MPIESVPSFSSFRLKSLLQERGWTQKDLSEMTGISTSLVSEYRSGKKMPSYENLTNLSEVLDVPERFFTVHPSPESVLVGPKLFRAYHGQPDKAASRAEARLGWVSECVHFCDRFLRLPKPDILADFADVDPFALKNHDIEAISLNVRRKLGFATGPVEKLLRALELAGVIVFRFEGVDAFRKTIGVSIRSKSGRAFIALAESGSLARDNFSLAHELGHLVLHSTVKVSNEKHPTDQKLFEEQANRFASAFLLPSPQFERDVYAPTLNGFVQLKLKWKTAISAMIRRCHEIGCIDKDRYTSLHIQLSQRRWKKKEPLDDKLPAESPLLLRKGFNQVIGAGKVDYETIWQALPFQPKDLIQMTGLPVDGFNFDSEPRQTMLFPNQKSLTFR